MKRFTYVSKTLGHATFDNYSFNKDKRKNDTAYFSCFVHALILRS